MQSPFVVCLLDLLEKKRFGDTRKTEILDRFLGLTQHYKKIGAVDPEAMAMARVVDEVSADAARKARMNYTALKKLSDLNGHFDAYTGKNEADAAKALFTMDARSKSGLNVETVADVTKGALWKVMDDIVDRMGKGKFGFQRGKAYFDNVVDEIFGKATGDAVAADLAKSWNKGTSAVVDFWHMAGGEMNRLDKWGLPQMQSLAKMLRNGGKDGVEWIADHMKWIDWDKMRWPNGAPIEGADRQRALEAAWETLSSDGANKIDPKSFKGNGHAIGDAIDQHRFLIYRDGDAWRGAHEKYGDGTVFDVMTNYIADVSHKIGLIHVFGNNPAAMMDTLKATAIKRANERGGGQAKLEVQAELKKSFDPLANVVMRRNAMDPESTMANVVLGTGNVLNSAQLAGALLVSVTGDFATTMITRAFNHLPVLTGLTSYFRNLVAPAEMMRLSVQSGFVMDEMVHSIYSKSRFSGVAEYGPAWTKKLSDFTLRASMLNVHTNAGRWTSQAEMMGALAANRTVDFDKLVFKDMMERYGITPKDWDRLRGMTPWEPYPGVERLRPSDLLANRTQANYDTYMRMQSMILQESRYMVPNSTTEASVKLKGDLRPDTLPGALLHSFAMYKNFPITLALMYGRVAMSQPTTAGKLGYTAALGSSLLLAGAVGLQLREMSKGRDPLPMDRASFWGKSALASGAMSIWGDLIFNGINDYGKSPTDVAAGPIVSFAGDTAQLGFGHMFAYADALGTLKANKDAHTPWTAKAVEYASRYTPGSSLWWGRAALQRELFDPLRAISDPLGAMNMMKKEQRRARDFGNESWWEPGTAFPQRWPHSPIGVQ